MPVLDPSAESDLPVVICAVSGLGGIGKTALALCAAHRAVRKGWFPGGTLFIDFRGYDKDPVTADQAMLALLDGMGVRGAELPQTVAAQYGLYRRLLAEERRSMLLILDNASDPEQVAPLVPGNDHHRVLITSRDRLTELDARLVSLDVLRPEAAAELIDRSLRLSDGGDDRAAREPEAVAELTVLCGHHPLALRIAVGMLRKRRYRGIASLVDELRDAEDRAGTLCVRPVFEVAYGQLPLEQARFLRLLCLAPAAEVSGEAAGALADLGIDETAGLLEELASSHLVTPVPMGGDVRWRVHDLVRAFGVSVVAGDADLTEEGQAARKRMLEFYHRWASAADARLNWLPDMPEPDRFAAVPEAVAWLDGERACLVGAVQWAREGLYADMAVKLAVRLSRYLDWRRYYDEWVALARIAQEAAHRAGDLLGEADAWDRLAMALREADQPEEAIAAHRHCLDLLQTAGDDGRVASAWEGLGLALADAGRLEEAMEADIRARDLFRAAGNDRLEGNTWNHLGIALHRADRVEEAIDAYLRARDLYEAVGDRNRAGMAWNNLGLALKDTGRLTEAIDAFGNALVRHREFGDWYREGTVLWNLARAHEITDQPAEARTAWLAAAEAFARADAPDEAAAAQSHAHALT
jgi:tetratricopeptide (TPR) repeat protein